VGHYNKHTVQTNKRGKQSQDSLSVLGVELDGEGLFLFGDVQQHEIGVELEEELGIVGQEIQSAG
jgi:hypothetical protein